MKRLEVQKEEIERLHLRSEEVREIMGHVPSRIIRYGISVILGVVGLIFLGSFFFSYPDTIGGRFVVHSSNPPLTLRAKVNGNIDLLAVKDRDRVQKGDVLAVISGTADYRHVFWLKLQLDASGRLPYTDTLRLGEIQPAYTAYGKALATWESFYKIDYLGYKVGVLKKQLDEKRRQLGMYRKTEELNARSLEIERNAYSRAEAIYKKGGISLTELEQGQSRLIQAEAAWNSACMSRSQAETAIAQTEQEWIEMQMQRDQEARKTEEDLAGALETLKTALREWENNYCMISAIDGIVSLSEVWKLHQNVIAGQNIISVVPEEKNEIIARVFIPVQGAGKIQEGNRVNLLFSDYPQEEFGIVTCRMNKMSLLPDSVYTSTFYLPDTLRTNYGKVLPFHQNMTGMAVIITEDLSLFDRFISPLRSMLVK